MDAIIHTLSCQSKTSIQGKRFHTTYYPTPMEARVVLDKQIKEYGITTDEAWIECSKCKKWRKIDKGEAEYFDKFVCSQNADPKYRSCDIAQELSSEEIDKRMGLLQEPGSENAHNATSTPVTRSFRAKVGILG